MGCRQGRIRAQQPGAYHCLSVCLSLSVGRWYRDTVRINKYPPCSVLQQPVRAALSACRQVSRRSTTAFAGVRLVGDAIVTGSASRTDRIGLASRRLADARPLRPRVPSVHAPLASVEQRRGWAVFPPVQSVVLAGRPCTTSEWCHHSARHVPLLRVKRPKYTQPGRRQARIQASCVGDLCTDCVPPGRAKTHLKPRFGWNSRPGWKFEYMPKGDEE